MVIAAISHHRPTCRRRREFYFGNASESPTDARCIGDIAHCILPSKHAHLFSGSTFRAERAHGRSQIRGGRSAPAAEWTGAGRAVAQARFDSLSSNAIATARTGVASLLERWYVLIVMCLVYALNIAARYVVTTVFEPIRLELHLTDTGAAFLTGVPLALFYVVCGIPIAWFADRSNRRNIVAAALILWSGFTVLCGVALNYWQFLFSRIGAGVGEAGATPPSTSIVSDCFPPERRPMALSVFALGAPVGAWLAADVAGGVAQAHGWRGAFLALGVPGVLLGLLVFITVREPTRGRLDAAVGAGKASFSTALAFLWRQR